MLKTNDVGCNTIDMCKMCYLKIGFLSRYKFWVKLVKGYTLYTWDSISALVKKHDDWATLVVTFWETILANFLCSQCSVK
jgi:hypothetical protein